MLHDAEYDIGTKEDLAAHMLRKATKKLRRAEKDYEDACEEGANGDFDDTASRAYYAVLFTILALHAMDGKSFKRHGQAVGEFNKVYIKNNIFHRSYGKAIMDMMIERHTSDYDPQEDVSQKTAEKCLEMAKRITNDIKMYFAETYPDAWGIYKKICSTEPDD